MPVIRIVMPNGTTRSFREGTPKSVIARAKRDMIASMNETDADHRAYRASRAVTVTGRSTGTADRSGNYDPIRSQEIRQYWRDQRESILHTAKVLGIPATAIAAAPAEEFRQQNGLFEWAKDAFGQFMLPGSNDVMESLYKDMQDAIKNGGVVQTGGWLGKVTNPLKMDVGIGNFNPGVGIDLVKNYLANPAFKDDPLGLRKYENNYDQLYRDLANKDSDATIKLTGLKLADVEQNLYKRVNAGVAGNARRDLYAAADPVLRDQLLGEGYRTSKAALDTRGTNQAPRPRSGYYDFYNDPRSPYRDLNQILYGQ